MTAPNGWPDEAREVVGRAMRQAQYKDRLLSSDWDSWQEAYWLDQANAALAALAPFVAVALARARKKGMEEAAQIAAERANALCDFGKHVRAAGAEEAAKDIRAKAQEVKP